MIWYRENLQSLCIDAVWTVPVLFAYLKVSYQNLLQAISHESIQSLLRSMLVFVWPDWRLSCLLSTFYYHYTYHHYWRNPKQLLLRVLNYCESRLSLSTGLKLRVRKENLFFLFLNQNICCGYSKEPSQSIRRFFWAPKTYIKIDG